VVGFKPGQTYQVTLSSGSTPVVSTDTFTTNANGTGDDNNLDYGHARPDHLGHGRRRQVRTTLSGRRNWSK